MTKRVILLAVTTGLSWAQDVENARMQAFDRDLGVECAHCHVDGNFQQADKAQFAFTIRMIKMQESLNAGTLRDLGGVTCWTCHRGNVKPARMPRAGWEERLAKWPAGLKLSDEDGKKRAEEVYGNIQSLKGSAAGGLAMTMSVFSAALGVGCEHCHVAGEWASDAKPAKQTARRMLGLFTEIPTHFERSRQPGMQCFTCHQGSGKPERRRA